MLFVIVATIYHLIFPHTAYAQSVDVTQSATVSATVPEGSLTAPQLLTPANNSVIKSHTGTFSFVRAQSGTSINHYDFIIDGVVLFNNLYDGMANQDTPLFTSYRNNQILYVDLKFNLSEGLHTWRIDAHSGGGATGSSEIFTFTIDSTLPIIILREVDQNNLYWASHIPSTIPPESNRYLTVDHQDPLFKGDVEPGSNLKLSLVCPTPRPTSCLDSTYTLNSPTGSWMHRFYNLLNGITYSAYLIATDAADNVTNFPIFYVTYGQHLLPTPTSTISTTPTPTTIPTASPTTIASITPSISVTPSPSISLYPIPSLPPIMSEDFLKPPAAPSPLPPKKPSTPSTPLADYLPLFRILFVFGLILHLIMTSLGANVYWRDIPSFLLNLLLPYFRSNTHQTIYYQYNPYHEQILKRLSFSIVYIYDPEDLHRPLHRLYSDSAGSFLYKYSKVDPETIFIMATRAGFEFDEKIISPLTLDSIQTLALISKQKMTRTDRFQLFCLKWRLLPLLIAVGTGISAFLIIPFSYYFLYALISTTYLYSEYLYPKLSSRN